jgi:hypothetical protein
LVGAVIKNDTHGKELVLENFSCKKGIQVTCEGCAQKSLTAGKDGGIKGNLNAFVQNHLASTEVKEQRRQLCKKCELNKAGICFVCGCVIALKTKIKTEACPRNNW